MPGAAVSMRQPADAPTTLTNEEDGAGEPDQQVGQRRGVPVEPADAEATVSDITQRGLRPAPEAVALQRG